MTLERTYKNWDAVRRASGTPSSRQRKLWREYLKQRPALAYWGDSWFSTPLYRNLYWQSFVRINGISLRLGKPGFTAAEMCTPSRSKDYAGRIASCELDALCVSIGGNDALGKRLQKIFEKRAPMDVDSAFDTLVADGVFERVRERYAILMDAMTSRAPHVPVVAHGYGRLQRIGVKGKTDIKNLGLLAPLIGNVGPWLWPAMRPILSTLENARLFSHRLLIDGFRELVLKPTSADFPKFSYADFTLLTEPDDAAFWYDEIHPTEDGFGVMATSLNAELRRVLPPAKRDAVEI